jgi:REP element-mobilizing transposase RayT
MKTWHERKRNRAFWHDYSKPGIYFITICTKDREHYFGKISDKKMELSEIGKIAQQCWEMIPSLYSQIELDNYVVMPNHLHGIIIIRNGTGNRHTRSEGKEGSENKGTGGASSLQDTRDRGTGGASSLQDTRDRGTGGASSLQEMERRLQRLPVVIGSYKSIVAKMAHKNQRDSDLFFRWQKSYYDHIIRNKKSLNFIRQYILNNSINWEEDLENPEYFSCLSEEERKAKLENHYNDLFKFD